ncbi:hypothetical protein D9M69_709390 [compost metagenome]
MVYACVGLLLVLAQFTWLARHGFSVKGSPFVRPMMTNWDDAGGRGRPKPPTAVGHCGQEMSWPCSDTA